MTRTLSDRTDTKVDEPADEADVDTDTTAKESAAKDSSAEASVAEESNPEESNPEESNPEESSTEESNPEDAATPADKKAGKAKTEKKSGPSALARLRTTLGGTRSRRIGVIVLALLAVAGLAGTAWFGTQWRSAQNTDKAADAAVVAARQFTNTLTSVSANSLDKDFTAVLAGSTGEFRQMYAKSSDQLRQLLIDNKAQAKGSVLASGVVSASTDKVVVVMFVDQTVQNVSNTQPRIDRSRIRVTMTKHDGRWLAEKVELP